MRQALAIGLIFILVAPLQGSARAPSVKEQVLAIARDAAVEVRLADNSKRKGRLGAVTDAGFELQSERQGSIVTEQLSFDRVKSVKQLHRESTGRSIGRTMMITGIVVGTVFAVLIVVTLIANAVD